VAFNGNTTLTLKVHVIQHGIHHVTLADSFGGFYQSVGQGTFTVVDMGYNAEVSDIFHRGAKIIEFANWAGYVDSEMDIVENAENEQTGC
jgi:hypothetical protein